MKDYLFTLMLLVSLSLHGGAAWFFHATYEPPVPLETRRGTVSIDMRASVAAVAQKKPPAPKPEEKVVKKEVVKEVAKKPELAPLPDKLPDRVETLPLPEKTPPPIKEPETLPLPEKTPPPPKEPEMLPPPEAVAEKPPPPKAIEAPKASDPSPGSRASDGVEEPRLSPINPLPPYPRADLLAGREATVLLRVRIDAIGRVSHVSIEKTSGSQAMDLSALVTMYVWRFNPARQNGVPVACERLIPMRFSIDRGS